MSPTIRSKYFLVGGAGFIGSHFCDFLLSDSSVEKVTIYDNFSSGRRWHLEHHSSDYRLKILEGDIYELEKMTRAMKGHDIVIHLASNPDISKAITEPDIDFKQGTILTNYVLEAMRLSSTKKILYASGSGVYGDAAEIEFKENHSLMRPISTYGASKLSGEVLICSYSHMFNITGICFRFGNVVGPRQTHGVGLDFIKSLYRNSLELKILGDGTQAKSYIAVNDVVRAVLLAERHNRDRFQVYNVATRDYITVREIADIAKEIVCGVGQTVKYIFTGGDRGWKGDVPIVKLNTDLIRSIGWKNTLNSHDSMKWSMSSIYDEVRKGLL